MRNLYQGKFVMLTGRQAVLAILLVIASCAAHGAPTADAQSLKVVTAAEAFMATLSNAQKKMALFSFKDAAQRVRWSNLPVGAVPRAGVRGGDLSTAQHAALMALLGAVLSPEGMRMVKEQMDADDVLGGGSRGARGLFGGRGGGGNFGSDNYYVAFLGAPSVTTPWTLQFGGHHLAINATVVGPNITLSPSLTGGQPTKYIKDGKAVYIVEREVRESFAMLNGLTTAQRGKAVISGQRIDLVLGPGHDGQVLQPEGLPGSAMTDAQKAQLLALIRARLDILNADDREVTLAAIRKDLNQTYFAWYGPTTADAAAYFRITGPTLVLEYAPQDSAGSHVHSMYRDPTNEYGAAWEAAK
jgi:hypothetical protein